MAILLALIKLFFAFSEEIRLRLLASTEKQTGLGTLPNLDTAVARLPSLYGVTARL